ncbi:unnamed protein product, partial [marine sediment metagenome]
PQCIRDLLLMNQFEKRYLNEFKIPLNPVRWRNLSNGVNPPLMKGDLLEDILKSQLSNNYYRD